MIERSNNLQDYIVADSLLDKAWERYLDWLSHRPREVERRKSIISTLKKALY